jgi:membrane carboxypeptidase/penicillin-binding protein PbpC
VTTVAVREKLNEYIRITEDKKGKAVYMMLENEITEEIEWWKDNAFVKELHKRFTAWETGKGKGYTIAEVGASIVQLKKRRSAK